MPYSVRCKACSAVFAIPDEIWDRRVRGRQATLKCRSCKCDIEVDGTKENAGKPSEAPAPTSQAAESTSTAAATSSAAEARAASGSNELRTPEASTHVAPTAQTASSSQHGSPEAQPDVARMAPPPTDGPTLAKAAPLATPPGTTAATAKATPTSAQSSPIHSTHAASSVHKPMAKTPTEIAATESGWSIMPPPSDLSSLERHEPESPVKATATAATATTTTAASTRAQAPSAATLAKTRAEAQVVVEARTPAASTTNRNALGTQDTATKAKAPIASSPSAPEAAPISELWVVSYGDDDDRELTEAQIALELSRGHINATTIVWREDLPEWLPISGVKALAKHLPAAKTATKTRTSGATPRTSGPSSPKLSSPTASKATTSAVTSTKVDSPSTSAATSTTKGPTTSAIPKQVAREKQPSAPALTGNTTAKPSAPREKQPSAPALTGGATATSSSSREPLPSAPESPQTGAAPNKVAVKGPPPLSRAAKPADAPARASQSGGKPPALPSRVSRAAPESPPLELAPDPESESLVEASVPWRKAQESSDEVLTSAPHIDQVSSPQNAAPVELETAPTADDAAQTESPNPPSPSPEVANATPGPAFPPLGDNKERPPEVAPWPKASIRPPKPVETATSMVVHTTTGTADVLSITDEDFLAMQRRFPKWALPAAVAGGVVLVGLVVYALASREAPPPLPVAPVVPVATAPTEPLQPRHAQPDLSTPPVASTKSAGGGEQDFAKAFAQAANKGQGSFDPKGAERSASAALDRAAKCRVGAEPAGQVRAVVTLAPTGQVTSVQVAPPYATTATGKCIDTALRGFTAKPFQGEPAKLPLIVPLR
ncbi:MAG: hypothetical protein QM784_23300 [Polyangiaceae bacterium]